MDENASEILLSMKQLYFLPEDDNGGSLVTYYKSHILLPFAPGDCYLLNHLTHVPHMYFPWRAGRGKTGKHWGEICLAHT